MAHRWQPNFILYKFYCTVCYWWAMTKISQNSPFPCTTLKSRLFKVYTHTVYTLYSVQCTPCRTTTHNDRVCSSRGKCLLQNFRLVFKTPGHFPIYGERKVLQVFLVRQVFWCIVTSFTALSKLSCHLHQPFKKQL